MKKSREGLSGLHSPKFSSFQKENASDQNTISFNPQNNEKITKIPLCNVSDNEFNPEGKGIFYQVSPI